MRIVFGLILLLGVMACQSGAGGEDSQESSESTDSLSFYNQRIADNPDDPKALLSRAKWYRSLGAYDEAIRDFQNVLRMDSLDARAHILLANTYLNYYQSRRALSTLEDANEMIPNHVELMLELANLQFILKQYEEALKTINKVLSIQPGNAKAYLILGLMFKESGDTARAINSLQTAVENDPELTEVWLLLGNTFEEMGNPIALRYYDNAVQLEPENPTTRHSRAFYLQNHGNVAAAIEDYKEILTQNPDYSDAYLNMAALYLEMDSIHQAGNMIEELLEFDSMNFIAHFLNAERLAATGRLNEAKLAVEKSLEIQPDYEPAKLLNDNLGQ